MIDALGSGSVLCPVRSAPLTYGALWTLLDFDADGPFALDWLEQHYRRASRMVGVLRLCTRAPGESNRMTFFWSLRGTDNMPFRARTMTAW